MLARRPTDDRDVGVEPALDELAALWLERVLLLRRTGGVNVLGVAGPSSVGASAPASPLPRFIVATLCRPRLLCSRHGQASTPHAREGQALLLAWLGLGSVGCCSEARQ